MTFSQEGGDILIRLSIEQIGVLAVEIEIVLGTKDVALKYVHRATNEILDE